MNSSPKSYYTLNALKFLVFPVAPTLCGTGTRAPTFTNGWARRGTVSRRIANKILTKVYTDHHESAHENL